MVAKGRDAGTRSPLAVELCGVPLATPLLPAAGTLSREALGMMDDPRVYGAVLPKTVTPRARRGNPPPRIAETASGMINSIGLQNPGIDRFLDELGSYEVGLPLFVSVAGDTAADFEALCARLAADARVSAVEANLSCPNVEHGGELFCSAPANVAEVVSACAGALSGSGKPLLVKLASEGAVPNAAAAEEAGASAVTLINTVPALAVDPYGRTVLRGGLSGPAIKPVALRGVFEVSGAVGIPVVGCGGVVRGTDVAEFMLAGAAAVQVGAGSFVRQPREILAEFAAYLEETGRTAGELVGGLGAR